MDGIEAGRQDADQLCYQHAVTGSLEHQREFQKIFWVNVDSLRVMARLSQKDIAVRLGFLPSSFATWRKRKKVFSYAVCSDLARLLDCTVSDLFSRTRYDYNRQRDAQGIRHDAIPYEKHSLEIARMDQAYRTIGAYDELTRTLVQDVVELGRADKQLLSELLSWKLR
jgi:transcriptional regulator with XRE-family HTH domain